jgi:hypothetical protein
MSSAGADIEWLLARSRKLLSMENMDVERLKAWGAERNAIFSRLKEHNSVVASTEPFANEFLLRELLIIDAQIRARIVECQSQLGKQIAVLRTRLQALPHASSHSSPLLQRLV